MSEALELQAERASSESLGENALPVCLWQENPHRLVEGWFSDMPAPEWRYTAGQIDRAGKVLSSPASTKHEADEAIAVMDSWRIAHNRPLEIARAMLEFRARSVNPNPTIGSRLKREESIRGKLLREPTMKLSKMQDIGGCRVILRDIVMRHIFFPRTSQAISQPGFQIEAGGA
jgi:hypothetical protein